MEPCYVGRKVLFVYLIIMLNLRNINNAEFNMPKAEFYISLLDI